MDPEAAARQAFEKLAHSLVVWRVCLTFVHLLAMVASVFRIHRRLKTRQFWLDDQFATASLILNCIYFPTLWLRELKSPGLQVFTTWLSLIGFTLVIGCARISLALSIVRVIPPRQPMHFASICLSCLLGAFCIGGMIQVCIECGGKGATWPNVFPYQCPLNAGFAISRICTDVFSDISLVAIPLWSFCRRLKLPIITRRLIRACFAASILTALSSILSSIVLFNRDGSNSEVRQAETSFLASVMSHLMASTSLLVCNTLVVVTSFYRFFRAQEPISIENPQPVVNPSPDIEAGEVTSVTATNDREDDETNMSSVNPTSTLGLNQDFTPSTSQLELTEIYESDLSDPRTPEIQLTGGRSLERFGTRGVMPF